ncbi:Protein phosphatase 2A, regulatory B subunit, B56 [Dillenia turbinata]|uniref:Protein phosphatase 2A, regulatory B subunit, B56 n=1 Tax=Dillenia turbinata TaxID=194707 RepID=A0AAN8URN1_9MAGN
MGVRKNAAKASPKKMPTTLKYLFDMDGNGGSPFDNGRQVSESEEILSIISYCTFVFTFIDPNESPSQQDLKRLKLMQLLSIVKTWKKPLGDQILKPLMEMIAANLFRPLPPPSFFIIISDLPDDEDPTSSPSPQWSHLQLVYDILLCVVLNMDQKILKGYLDQPFLSNLLSLFQSEDPRERESLKNVYHKIYSRFTFHRAFMRKSMNDVFLRFAFETERHCGIPDLLEIWGSIINGFTLPLKEEHKAFLMKVLIPLHRPKGMQVYHRQLTYCVSQFVQKEPALGGTALRGILKYWPMSNCQKEVLFIGELEELVDIVDPEQYKKLALPICTQITKCFNSWNSQVAERGLYIWNNEAFVQMALQAKEEVFPLVVEGMEKNLNWHWSRSVRQLTENAKEMLEEMEPVLYAKCLQELEAKESADHHEEIKRQERWERIEMQAAKNQFLSSHSICVD